MYVRVVYEYALQIYNVLDRREIADANEDTVVQNVPIVKLVILAIRTRKTNAISVNRVIAVWMVA